MHVKKGLYLLLALWCTNSFAYSPLSKREYNPQALSYILQQKQVDPELISAYLSYKALSTYRLPAKANTLALNQKLPWQSSQTALIQQLQVMQNNLTPLKAESAQQLQLITHYPHTEIDLFHTLMVELGDYRLVDMAGKPVTIETENGISSTFMAYEKGTEEALVTSLPLKLTTKNSSVKGEITLIYSLASTYQTQRLTPDQSGQSFSFSDLTLTLVDINKNRLDLKISGQDINRSVTPWRFLFMNNNQIVECDSQLTLVSQAFYDFARTNSRLSFEDFSQAPQRDSTASEGDNILTLESNCQFDSVYLYRIKDSVSASRTLRFN